MSRSWPFVLVRLARGLFWEVLVLPCGCRFDAAGWQLQPSLGSPLPPGAPPGSGKEQARDRLATY